MSRQDSIIRSARAKSGWRKSTYTANTSSGSSCVETLAVGAVIAVRDSKLVDVDDYPVLTADPADWTGLLSGIRSGTLPR
ncbi:MAG: DUF397 domain-containing protein [Stackebrandtia sp.]